MRSFFAGLGAILLLCACGRDDQLLLGSWQATSVTEAGDSVRLDPAEVGFVFRPDNRYTFRSTLRYAEAGTWTYADGFLQAVDTTDAAQPKRVVAVDKLTADSLVLRMNGDTAQRVVVLLREE
ncbi:MAG: lipocalin family protein [Bacteroidota bacterium]